MQEFPRRPGNPTGPVTTEVARLGRCNPSVPVTELTVNLGRGRPSPVATLQIDFIYSASAIGTWTVEKEFEIVTLEDFLRCC